MNIVVAVDFSEVTQRVIEVAMAQAKDRDAHLWLLHAVEPEPAFVGFDPGPAVVRDQVAHEFREERRSLERLAEQVRTAGIAVTPRIVQAPTVAAILDQAREKAADLIVMGTHGRGVAYQVLVGSVSEGVLRHATCPLLLVPARRKA